MVRVLSREKERGLELSKKWEARGQTSQPLRRVHSKTWGLKSGQLSSQELMHSNEKICIIVKHKKIKNKTVLEMYKIREMKSKISINSPNLKISESGFLLKV